MKEFSDRLGEIVGKERIKELHQQADIAAQISKERKKKGLSQQDLAEKIDVAKSTIGRIEAGMTSPNAATLYKISSVLDVPFVINGKMNRNHESIPL